MRCASGASHRSPEAATAATKSHQRAVSTGCVPRSPPRCRLIPRRHRDPSLQLRKIFGSAHVDARVVRVCFTREPAFEGVGDRKRRTWPKRPKMVTKSSRGGDCFRGVSPQGTTSMPGIKSGVAASLSLTEDRCPQHCGLSIYAYVRSRDAGDLKNKQQAESSRHAPSIAALPAKVRGYFYGRSSDGFARRVPLRRPGQLCRPVRSRSENVASKPSRHVQTCGGAAIVIIARTRKRSMLCLGKRETPVRRSHGMTTPGRASKSPKPCPRAG